MVGPWFQDLESLEAIRQDDETRTICQRMAALSMSGGLSSFVTQIAADDELDERTKDELTELASDETFLLALDDYVRRTEQLH